MSNDTVEINVQENPDFDFSKERPYTLDDELAEESKYVDDELYLEDPDN